MLFRKMGKIFDPIEYSGGELAFAQMPTPLVLGDVIRVFVGTRTGPDERGNYVSHIGFVDVDRNDPLRLRRVRLAPCLAPGEAGTFDEFGVIPFDVKCNGDELTMHFAGYQRLGRTPYRVEIGRAQSDDWGETFRRFSKGATIHVGRKDPFLVTGPCIISEDSGWRVFYSSGTGWIDVNGRFESVYGLASAVSEDLVNWKKDEEFLIEARLNEECQARPWVVWRNGVYHLWFSYRPARDFRDGRNGYRVGYAWSEDLVSWYRDDAFAGIQTSQEGWDSEMVEYTATVEVDGKVYLFYNGNEFGRHGFGVAQLMP